MAARSIHIHFDIPWLLRKKNKGLSEFVNHPDGIEAARAELKSMVDEGVTCLVLDNDCNNKKANGSCAGHEVTE
tara:strand:- start:1056 stop:1277 length:222 start_codon:yes stop_codon:yes gene_type:complete